ncbi:unnamed protein product [Brassica oleracea var. botrytis]|uniref:BnaC03g59480D protein n=2 Tax=Brassica napus TaxID=3708 RepID=A0A078H9Y5_BRANA|nr:hypothetical protein HID58_056185 [Brassica napus]CAF1709800.1 unnamed protein product [Brassica napus]CDY35275.1 BnaC03g59480D [Brassica napus]
MSESSSSFSSLTLLLLIIFLLVLLCPSLSSSSESEVRVLDRELLEIKTNPKLNKTSRKPKCCEMRTRSQCSGFPRCRWCRSEALDDLCFGKAEALRLPSQVFRSIILRIGVVLCVTALIWNLGAELRPKSAKILLKPCSG